LREEKQGICLQVEKKLLRLMSRQCLQRCGCGDRCKSDLSYVSNASRPSLVTSAQAATMFRQDWQPWQDVHRTPQRDTYDHKTTAVQLQDGRNWPVDTGLWPSASA